MPNITTVIRKNFSAGPDPALLSKPFDMSRNAASQMAIQIFFSSLESGSSAKIYPLISNNGIDYSPVPGIEITISGDTLTSYFILIPGSVGITAAGFLQLGIKDISGNGYMSTAEINYMPM